MGLIGGEDELRAFADVVIRLPAVMSQASRDACDFLEDVIDHQFSEGVDPYGQKWADLAPSTIRRGRRPPPLTDTGALGAPFIHPLQNTGLEVVFPEDYASFHQTGTSRMPQRRLGPDEGAFESSTWYPAIVEAYVNAFERSAIAKVAVIEESGPLSNAAE